jgi:pimeloyl-ACP methyl ester carboxylesterase
VNFRKLDVYQIACADRRIGALVGLGLPLDIWDMDFLVENRKPALYIVGTRDKFCSLKSLDRFARRLLPASQVHRIEGAEHFFNGHVEIVESLIAGFFEKLATGQDTA